MLSALATLARADAASEGAQVRRYTRSLLVDIHGTPIRQASLAAETNYVFQYPFASTPCFLLRLPEPVAPVPALHRERRSSTSSGRVIHCCADHSVYDPMAGARVVAGPAPQPLASIALEYDAGRDEISAIGTIGAEQFGPFFEKYAFKLELEYGGLERARQPVDATTVVRELTNYCRTTIEC